MTDGLVARGERLTAEDAARLHMSVRDNPMLITAVLTLDRSVDQRALESRLASRLVRHARFRQRIAEPRLGLGMPRWTEDPAFDVRHHVHRIDPSLLSPEPELEDLVSNLAAIPIGQQRPLWRAHIIDGHAPALVLMVHHALADGTALLRLLGEIADEPPPQAKRTAFGAPLAPRSRLRQIAAGAAAAGRLALQPNDPVGPLRQAGFAGERRLVFSAPIALDEARSTAHRLGTTVTGVLLLAVTGALRAEIGSASHSVVLHALVPVDVRSDGSSDLGNRFGSVLVPLPVGTPDLATRVESVRVATRDLRSASAGVAAARLAAAAGAATAIVERIGVEIFSRKASVVVSSVRGPTTELHLCGAAVRDVIVWSPPPGRIALGVTLMSYAGGARIGLAADARAIGDARRMVRELELELSRLRSFASAFAT